MLKPSFNLKYIFQFVIIFNIVLSVSCSSSKVISSSSVNISSNVVSDGINGNWDRLGFQKGDHVPDFTLYDIDGKKFNLSSELKLGKPVILIGSSYTCDISRSNIPNLKLLESKYGSVANVFVVYLIEPHPKDVPSPYSKDGKIWIVPKNIRDHVEADQPKTYQQRKELSKKWKQVYDINLPVLVDNTDNYFWSKFGQSPNMVYVILPNDAVYYKQAWFNMMSLDDKLKTLELNP